KGAPLARGRDGGRRTALGGASPLRAARLRRSQRAGSPPHVPRARSLHGTVATLVRLLRLFSDPGARGPRRDRTRGNAAHVGVPGTAGRGRGADDPVRLVPADRRRIVETTVRPLRAAERAALRPAR